MYVFETLSPTFEKTQLKNLPSVPGLRDSSRKVMCVTENPHSTFPLFSPLLHYHHSTRHPLPHSLELSKSHIGRALLSLILGLCRS